MTPLALYVLWHPQARHASALAGEVYRWFHAASDDLLRSGMGVPVYFRSRPAGGGAREPLEIAAREAGFSVAVVLAEAHMVADAAWRGWLERLAHGERVFVIPVALDPSAYRLPESLRRLNFLRVDERDDPPARDDEALLARRRPRLLRQLTEVIGRQLAARLAAPPGERPAPPPPLTIFLSHAKKDGVEVAEALRASIQGRGRLRAFFDDSDLPVGHAFAGELDRAAVAGSAAMIAVVSDAYAARPWCRREVALARRPRAEPEHPRCWAIQPVLAVDHLNAAATRGIPELGNATLIRWQPERALETVDLLMLEVLLGSYHRLRAREVPPAEGRHVISWTPDLATLLALQRAAGPGLAEVAYPGHALPEAEAEALRQAFPDLRLRTFEDVEAGLDLPPRPIAERVVGLSLGTHPDLDLLGLGREHLDEITLRVARCVVEAGGRIAFGGMVRSSGLTETLLTLARTLTTDDDSPGAATPVARILSYQRWPSLPGTAEVAGDVGICEYVLIENPLPPSQRLANDARVASPERSRQHAHALSAMRLAMTAGGCRTSAGTPAPPLAARVVLGGLREDFNGFMPGVLEEALHALEAGLPVYVIGGFGGAAALLAQGLVGATRPAELEASFHLERSARLRMLAKGLAAHGEASRIDDLFLRLARCIERVREDLVRGLANGLDLAQNRRLMQTDRVSEVVALLQQGFARRFSGGPP